VSNAYTIYLLQEDSLGKLRIILHSLFEPHGLISKAPAVIDECAYH
jgi:hypothetical protein